ncbi:MAG: cation diffusion facilitator family transporter [Nitrospirota bacterium]|nr:cation diffusion facilitator family transporter [Nitrospirota bacterium]
MAHTIPAYTNVRSVLWKVLWLNLLVAAAKLGYGVYIGSVSLTADGYHSAFDGMSNVIALIGLWVAAHPADENHPYGHRKFETLATVGIGIMLTMACLHVLESAYERFNTPSAPEVGPLAYVVVILTMAINWFVFRYEHTKADEFHSEVLHADSKHTQSDLLVTTSVLCSLVAADLGIWLLDPIVAVLIAGLIGKAAYDIILESALLLSDVQMIAPEEIREVAMEMDGVMFCHEIRTRGTKHHVLMDLRIHVDPHMTVLKAHKISDDLEDRLKDHFEGVQEVVVHVEPHGAHYCPAAH